jgi:hypothetical protein
MVLPDRIVFNENPGRVEDDNTADDKIIFLANFLLFMV